MDKNMLNIPSYIEDPSYRYKMPRMNLKIEGKGNGIKTNIVNMQDVSKALRVPTEYPLKFMGFEYGSLIIFKEKGNDITTIINGAFRDEQLQKALDKFIEKYVLCPKCKYPEFVLRVKQGIVCGKCDSCGERAKCDNAHKFASYIVKNPPKIIGIKKEEEEDKQEKKTTQVVKSSQKEEKEVKIVKKEVQDVQLEGEELKKSIATLTESIKNMKQQNGDFTDKEIAVTNIIKELKDLNFSKGLESALVFVLFQSLFSINIAFEVAQNSEVLIKTILKIKIPRPEVEIILNLAYILFSTYKEQEFSQYVSTILKSFYDVDLITEATLVEWADGKIDFSNYFLYQPELVEKLRTSATPFLEWVKKDDDDEEEEEEEEEEKQEEQVKEEGQKVENENQV